MSRYIVIEHTASDGSPLDPDILPVDTDHEVQIARAALRANDLEFARVYNGDPDGDNVRTDHRLWA